MKPDAGDDGEEGSGGIQPDLIKSYLAFGARAVRKRLVLVGIIFVVVATLVAGATTLMPRTYYCEMKLTVQDAGALGEGQVDPFSGLETTILRQNTLEAIIKQTDAVKSFATIRTPIQRWKEKLTGGHSEPSEQDKTDILVSMLGERYKISSWNGNVTIGVEWPDPVMSARLVEAAQQTYLESRHGTEVATLAEYISILEGHANKERSAIVEIAGRIDELRRNKRAEKVAQVEEKRAATERATAEADAGAPRPVVRRVVRNAAPLQADAELTKMSVLLQAKEGAVAELERDRAGRVNAMQGQMRELLLRYTDVHPEVIRLRQSIDSISRESPQVVSLRAEANALKEQIAQRQAQLASGAPTTTTIIGGGSGQAPAAGLSSLPIEVISLMDQGTDDIDPTITGQFQYAVSKYASLRAEIDSKRLTLDRAQAAFSHRYKVIAPAMVPFAPAKPKVKIIVLGGIAGAFLLALIVALLAELRTGKIVERWQVYSLDLPVLGELKLPPDPTRGGEP